MTTTNDTSNDPRGDLRDRIHAHIYDALRTVESFDLYEQPGADQKLESIAATASALSTTLDELCGGNGRNQSAKFIEIIDRLNDRIRWSNGTLDVIIDDRDLDNSMRETLAGVGGHLREADAILDELNALRQVIAGSAKSDPA